ncbi:hypothetical protein PENTCL1PPCAC_5619, partial [Pristionchus entomophagus]
FFSSSFFWNQYGMTLRETRLSTVQDWKEKICEFAIQSDDNLASVLSKGFDVASIILKGSEHRNIQRALESLGINLSICMRSEKTKDPSIRTMMCGFIESVHLVLLQLTEERNQPRDSEETSEQTNQIPNFTQLLPMTVKEEPIDVSHSIPDSNKIFALSFTDDNMVFKTEEEYTLNDGIPHSVIMGDIRMDESPSEYNEAKKRKRQSRSVAKPLKFTESNEDCDRDSYPSVKKSRPESKTEIRPGRPSKIGRPLKNDTELNCPDCEYRSRSVYGSIIFDANMIPLLHWPVSLCSVNVEMNLFRTDIVVGALSLNAL